MTKLTVDFRSFANAPKKQEEKRQRTGKLGEEQKTTEGTRDNITDIFNPLNAKLNPICHLPPLLGAHHILHFSRIKVKHNTAGTKSMSCTAFKISTVTAV